jgi:L-lysine exporter family protein LysE/ArgO
MISVFSGFFTAISLIAAIGAQNAYVIRQSLTRKHVLLVVVICALADAILIIAGIAGLGALITSAPMLMEFIRWFGVLYLAWFGIKSVRSAFKKQSLDAGSAQSASRKQVVLSILGFTFLNPHVYLDTVILLGSIANQFQSDRWWFGMGAMLSSVVWFFSIGYGAKAAAKYMAKPIFWQILDLIIAAVMFGIAAMLAFFQF